MQFIRKLRPPEMNVETCMGMAMAPIMALLYFFLGLSAMFFFVACIQLLLVLIQLGLYFRTRNIAFLWMALAFLVFFIFILNIALYGVDNKSDSMRAMAAGVMTAGVVVLVFMLTRRVKWKTREIFELSALPVKGTADGFTERPLASGKIEGSPDEVAAFTRFISKNLIAIPHYEGERVIYSLSSNYWKKVGVKRGYKDESWIAIDPDGQVHVFITRNDYQKFREEITFDQLCLSLGRLFAEFFHMFQRGDGVRIIQRFNDLRLNPLIE